MTYRGRVQNGVVVLAQPHQLPEGVEVRVEVVSPTRKTLAERLPS